MATFVTYLIPGHEVVQVSLPSNSHQSGVRKLTKPRAYVFEVNEHSNFAWQIGHNVTSCFRNGRWDVGTYLINVQDIELSPRWSLPLRIV